MAKPTKHHADTETPRPPRRLNKAERALLELTRASTPSPNLTQQDGVREVERGRRGERAK